MYLNRMQVLWRERWPKGKGKEREVDAMQGGFVCMYVQTADIVAYLAASWLSPGLENGA